MRATALTAMTETACVGSFGVQALAGMALAFLVAMLLMVMSGGAMGGDVLLTASRTLGAGELAWAVALEVHAMWIGQAARVWPHCCCVASAMASLPLRATAARRLRRLWRIQIWPSQARSACDW